MQDTSFSLLHSAESEEEEEWEEAGPSPAHPGTPSGPFSCMLSALWEGSAFIVSCYKHCLGFCRWRNGRWGGFGIVPLRDGALRRGTCWYPIHACHEPKHPGDTAGSSDFSYQQAPATAGRMAPGSRQGGHPLLRTHMDSRQPYVYLWLC